MEGHRHRHDPSKSLVGFVVGEVSYAVPIARVREISNPLDLVPLPHAPMAVSGVADYRGEVVPVVELRTRFGLEPAPQTRRTKWIIVEVGQRLVALVVDAVTEVFGTGGAELRPAPALGGGDDVRGIAGVTTHAGALTFVLETGHLRDVTEPLDMAGTLGAAAPVAKLSGGDVPSSKLAGKPISNKVAP
jgi:purine-binding chemotaxis protein CheW